ncbi:MULTISPECIES: hypothetical protein [Kocuria]|uniref:Lipoprotein n=1 Tax=Kocuria varians TaxID=1272 RepID=A0A7D7KY89_KOCVA|nr:MULTISPECIES: hypothetical protein [Kocuria]QMS55926.1 hypothetical protein CIB50_0000624 [Kocuria varians]RUP83726.1 hypothetical protein D8M39_06945 [Kocuria sp. HSID17590]RUQ12756.1 hypothetical protein D8M38_01455 [Kocuria sp. HSID17582]
MRSRSIPLASALCALLLLSGCGGGPTENHDDAGGDAASSSQETSATPTPEKPAELIGGGTQLFPDRRFVALYGHPGTPGLGALGEQGPEESVTRVKELAKSYEPYSEEKVIPAFEIIATTASSEPGPDGNYSTESTVDQLKPYVEAAERNDVYVVLDLQPGQADFLTQATQYEELLKHPNVGLALDPEWRLAPGQLPLQQIGSVDAAEINKTSDWLATLTRDNRLPQKTMLLHQFSMSMIENREAINTQHPELAFVLHADGHGTPDLKTGTWNALQEGLPKGIRMAWKNFYDEDTPMYTPQQTFGVTPKPWFVSYQ